MLRGVRFELELASTMVTEESRKVRLPETRTWEEVMVRFEATSREPFTMMTVLETLMGVRVTFRREGSRYQVPPVQRKPMPGEGVAHWIGVGVGEGTSG